MWLMTRWIQFFSSALGLHLRYPHKSNNRGLYRKFWPINWQPTVFTRNSYANEVNCLVFSTVFFVVICLNHNPFLILVPKEFSTIEYNRIACLSYKKNVSIILLYRKQHVTEIPQGCISTEFSGTNLRKFFSFITMKIGLITKMIFLPKWFSTS